MPVPGAGFSPEAVPGNSAKRRTPKNYQPLLPGIDDKRRSLERGVGSQFVRMSDLHRSEGLWGEKMHRRIVDHWRPEQFDPKVNGTPLIAIYEADVRPGSGSLVIRRGLIR
jgi:hypothetical protein